MFGGGTAQPKEESTSLYHRSSLTSYEISAIYLGSPTLVGYYHSQLTELEDEALLIELEDKALYRALLFQAKYFDFLRCLRTLFWLT